MSLKMVKDTPRCCVSSSSSLSESRAVLLRSSESSSGNTHFVTLSEKLRGGHRFTNLETHNGKSGRCKGLATGDGSVRLREGAESWSLSPVSPPLALAWSDLRLSANSWRSESLSPVPSFAPVLFTSDSVARNWIWEVTRNAIVDEGLWNVLDDPCLFRKDDGKQEGELS